MGSSGRLCRGLLALLSLISTSTGSPLFAVPSSLSNVSLENRANGYDFRLLPVGDSITLGRGSSDGNSYRLDLRKLLINAG